jgi:hypothetical protein
MIKLRCSYGAQKHGIAVEAGVQGSWRQGAAGFANSLSANGPLDELEFTVIKRIEGAQHANGFMAYFRPDTIARENCYLKTH